MNYHWNWSIFSALSPDGQTSYFAFLWGGVGWTLTTALLAWMIALLLGIVIGVLRTTQLRIWAGLANAYVELFRNIPLLVQMFLWYFVLPEILPEAAGLAMKQWPPPWGSFVPAILCLGFFTSARVAEQVRAGIQALPRGQSMAATALGLRPVQVYRHVLLPMAFRLILPPLTSEFMNVIKNSSLALTIGLMELTARARSMQEFTFQVFEAFTAATVVYILLNIVAVVAARWLEARVAVPGFISTTHKTPAALLNVGH